MSCRLCRQDVHTGIDGVDVHPDTPDDQSRTVELEPRFERSSVVSRIRHSERKDL